MLARAPAMPLVTISAASAFVRPLAAYCAADGSGAVWCVGALARELGNLARTAGRPADAVRHHRDGQRTGAGHLLVQAAAELAALDMPGPAVAVARSLARLEASAPTGPLSGREQEVAGWVTGGLSNRAIAARLHLSERTVESHVRSILTKLGLHNRTQVASWRRDRRSLAIGASRSPPGRPWRRRDPRSR